MKKIFVALCIVFCLNTSAQIRMPLSPNGFAAVEATLPAAPAEHLIESVKGWAYNFNRNGVDVYDVTANSLKIDAIRKQAFYYMNRGQRYDFNVKYTLKVVFGANTFTTTFSIREIYDNENHLQKAVLSDYFDREGKVKEDYAEMPGSLQKTAERIVGDFIQTIQASH